MKLEIDLNDILGDEYGSETIQESIRRQVIDSLTAIIKSGVGKQIDAQVSNVINAEIKTAIEGKIPQFVDDVLSARYQKVNQWGEKTFEPTTFREEIVKSINEQMIYKKSHYNSDKNAFSRAMDELVEEKVKSFKEKFNKEVDGVFVQEAMAFAQQKLKERLGIK